MLEIKTQLAAAIESEEGVAETLDAGDCVLHAAPKFNPDTPMFQRPMRSASLSPFKAVPGLRMATIEFDIELKGSGTAGTAPEYGPLLKACGFGETVVAGTSVAYDPASASIPSLTMALYEDGVIHKIWGARGTVKLSLKGGDPGMLHFVFTGADFSVTDGAMLEPSYQTTVPPAFLAAQFTIQTYAALISMLEIDMANAMAMRPDANQPSGYKSAVISGRLPVMSMDPEKVLVATHDFYGNLRSGTEGALSTVLGSTAGNICTISAPKVQYTKIDEQDREGLRNLGIDCQLNRNTGDDEISMAFT
jgi:Phage tail tube protein